MTILLFLSLAALILAMVIGEIPDGQDVLDWAKDMGVLGVAVVVGFLVGTFFLLSPLSGIVGGFLGWLVVRYARDAAQYRQQDAMVRAARDFVGTAAGMFAAGKTTAEVIREASENLPDPLGAEMRGMVSKQLAGGRYPDYLEEVGNKYDVAELKAVADILRFGKEVGGLTSIAKGLSRLGTALRRRDRLLAERKKATAEPAFTSAVAMVILGVGLIVDATALREDFITLAGRIDLALGFAVIVGLVFMTLKIYARARKV